MYDLSEIDYRVKVGGINKFKHLDQALTYFCDIFGVMGNRMNLVYAIEDRLIELIDDGSLSIEIVNKLNR